MRLERFLRATALLGMVGLAPGIAWAATTTEVQERLADGAADVTFSVLATVSVATSVTGAEAVTEVVLPPAAQIPFQQYLDAPRTLGSKAFAIDPESGQSGQSTRLSRPGIAVDQAIEDCRRRSARDCRLYAVGDIVVLGLADWKTEVAIMLDQVMPGATNGDLEAVTSGDGGKVATSLRRSVLHAAAEMGSTDAVAAMLDRGIDIDAGSDIGATALSYAASRGQHEAVALLLEHRADVNARNRVGKTALGLAVLANNFARHRDYLAAGHVAVIRLLEDAGGTE